jgi:hypothetical protein
MSIISATSTNGYSVSALTGGVQQTQTSTANFADFLKDKEESAASAQVPAISGLMNSSGALSVVAMADHSAAQAADADEADGKSAVDAFREYMDMTPEERLFVSMLAKHGYTKEQYEALPEDEKLKLEKQIQEEIRTQHEQKITMGKSAGTSTDEMAQQAAGAANQKRDSLFG